MKLSRDEAELFAQWYRCLADPTRLQILNLLADARRSMSVGEIVDEVDVGQSTVSQHLRKLAETCFVLVEHEGTSSYFRINENCIACFPSAAECVMGEAQSTALPSRRPGATSRSARLRARRRPHSPPPDRARTHKEKR